MKILFLISTMFLGVSSIAMAEWRCVAVCHHGLGSNDTTARGYGDTRPEAWQDMYNNCEAGGYGSVEWFISQEDHCGYVGRRSSSSQIEDSAVHTSEGSASTENQDSATAD